jgi:Tfp pilus assembly protein PilN
LSALTSELGRLQDHRDAAIQQINDYKIRYPLQSPDPNLLRKVEEMSTIRQATLTLQQLLTDSQLGNRSGFSEHLTGLARQDLSTVWLRRIRFNAGGEQLLIEGSTSHAADVPLYLQRLTEQKIFTDCEFEHLQLKRAENASPVIDFLLQTTQEGDS